MDSRLETFLILCETMNYRKAAEILHLSQPAVTKQIQSLEAEFDVQFFTYDGRKLSRTKESFLLEDYAISLKYSYGQLVDNLRTKEVKSLRVGATKTIGDFVIGKRVKEYLKKPEHNLSFLVDNTENLLEKLRNQQLDFALVEGYFDKKKYGYYFFAREPFVGICSKDHPFAGKQVSLESLWKETLFIREEGSGTRQIFEQQLKSMGYSLEHFGKVTSISSFLLIRELVAEGIGITFAYQAVTREEKEFATFTIKDNPVFHEFYFVYLKNTGAEEYVEFFLEESQKDSLELQEEQQ